MIILLIYALIVGAIAKALHPGPNPVGWVSTIGVGLAGTYIGGFLQWVLFEKGSPIHTSGWIMGIIGGVLALSLWRWWCLQNASDGPRSFWSGQLK